MSTVEAYISIQIDKRNDKCNRRVLLPYATGTERRCKQLAFLLPKLKVPGSILDPEAG
jgi:hypothetical protein